MFYSRAFLDDLFLTRDRQLYVRITLLTWDELPIKNVEGIITDGTLSVDGNSIIRRTLTMTFVHAETGIIEPLHEIAHEISINKKIKIEIGLKNNTKYGRFPDLTTEIDRHLSQPIIWFNLGIFVPTEVSLNHSIEDSSLSLTAQDKMVLLNGDIAGEVGYDIDFVNTITNQNLAYQTIIKDSISFFGGIDESKILVLDVPYYAESLTRVPQENFTYYGNGQNGDNEIFFSSGVSTSSFQLGQTLIQVFTGEANEGVLSASSTISAILANSIEISKNIQTSGNFTFYTSPALILYANTVGSFGKRTFNIDTAVGYTSSSGTALSPAIEAGVILPLQLTLSPQNKDTKIEVASTNKVTDILDQVKSGLLGEYEYFFDVDGNFVFQYKKNLESSFTDIQLFQNDNGNKYLTNFDSIPYIYDLSDKEIISSYSNSPNWRGIKNDFYIYGANNLLYHLVIDTIPQVPSTFYTQSSDGTWTNTLAPYNQPWQQYIIDLTEYNAQENPSEPENRYYAELKKYFEFNQDANTGIYRKLSPTTGVWRSNNTGEFNDLDITQFEYMVIGGGGAGSGGGGGGAGGFKKGTLTVTPNTNYTITVGAGGVAGINGTSGQTSSLATVSSSGGGAGGSFYAGYTFNGLDGGSGGGAGFTGTRGLGIVGQGNNGGTGASTANFGAGGGGGADAVGANGTTTQAGNGGAGTASAFPFTSYGFYCGGGGGGIFNTTTGRGIGGTGGGGDAGLATNVNGVANNGSPGSTNSGGGGGGGSSGNSALAQGGNGGSGAVFIRYPSNRKNLTIGTGLTYSFSNTNGYKIYSFTQGTGTITT